MNQTKKAYQAPKLIVHGDAAQLTQMTTTGQNLDATFPAGTPLSQLTVS